MVSDLHGPLAQKIALLKRYITILKLAELIFRIEPASISFSTSVHIVIATQGGHFRLFGMRCVLKLPNVLVKQQQKNQHTQ